MVSYDGRRRKMGGPSKASEPPTHVPQASPELALAALGVVFGDIGTSPLYTLHECIRFDESSVFHPSDVLGVLSLIFWALTLVVTVKYLGFIMKADTHGEGAIFALLALIPERLRAPRAGTVGWAAVLVVIG